MLGVDVGNLSLSFISTTAVAAAGESLMFAPISLIFRTITSCAVGALSHWKKAEKTKNKTKRKWKTVAVAREPAHQPTNSVSFFWLIICTVSGSAYPQMANIWSIQWPLSSSSSLPSCPLLHLWISPRLLRFCCYRQAHVIFIWPVQLRCSFLLSQFFSSSFFLSLLRYWSPSLLTGAAAASSLLFFSSC